MSLTLDAQSQPSVVAGTVRAFYDTTTKRFRLVFEDGRIGDPGDADLSNYARNSGLWFAQRQIPATATNCGSTTLRAAGGASGADGWGVWNENANTTFARVDAMAAPETGLQSRYYGSWLKATATGKFFVNQMLEGHETAPLRGRTVRVQGKIKGTGNQTVRLGLVQLNSSGTVDTLPATFISAAGANGTDPTLGTNLAYIAPKAGVTGDNCTVNGNAADCSVTVNWQRFGAVFDVPSNCRNLVMAFWTNSQLAAASGFSLSELSLTDGYEIQDWAPLPYDQEFSRVRRNYYKTFNVDQQPAQSVGVNTGEFKFPAVVSGAAVTAGVGFRYPNPMRAAATTLTLYNPSAATAQVRNVTDAADHTASSIAADGEQGCWITHTGLAGTASGEHLAVHLSADAGGANQEFT